MQLSLPDDRVLPASTPARQVSDIIRREFPSKEAGALSVVAPGIDAAAHAAEIDAYAKQLAALTGVSRVDAATGSYLHDGPAIPADSNPALYTRFVADGATFVSVIPSVEPLSDQGEQLVKDVRPCTHRSRCRSRECPRSSSTRRPASSRSCRSRC